MLKTPKYPIWITLMNNLVAIIFCTNVNLLNDWRFEQCFSLYFYGGLRKQEHAIKFSIGQYIFFLQKVYNLVITVFCQDTRNLSGSDINAIKKKHSRKFTFISIDEEKEPDIIEIIRTK